MLRIYLPLSTDLKLCSNVPTPTVNFVDTWTFVTVFTSRHLGPNIWVLANGSKIICQPLGHLLGPGFSHTLFIFYKERPVFWLVFFSIYSNWCSLNLFFISFKNLKVYWPIYYLILNYYAILDNLEYNPTVFAKKFPFFMFFLPLFGKIWTKMSSLFFNFDLWH